MAAPAAKTWVLLNFPYARAVPVHSKGRKMWFISNPEYEYPHAWRMSINCRSEYAAWKTAAKHLHKYMNPAVRIVKTEVDSK